MNRLVMTSIHLDQQCLTRFVHKMHKRSDDRPFCTGPCFLVLYVSFNGVLDKSTDTDADEDDYGGDGNNEEKNDDDGDDDYFNGINEKRTMMMSMLMVMMSVTRKLKMVMRKLMLRMMLMIGSIKMMSIMTALSIQAFRSSTSLAIHPPVPAMVLL